MNIKVLNLALVTLDCHLLDLVDGYGFPFLCSSFIIIRWNIAFSIFGEVFSSILHILMDLNLLISELLIQVFSLVWDNLHYATKSVFTRSQILFDWLCDDLKQNGRWIDVLEDSYRLNVKVDDVIGADSRLEKLVNHILFHLISQLLSGACSLGNIGF